MGLFENFPYTNLQQLNLNWIIKKLKEVENGTVLSVNGMTGNVILYEGQSVQLPGLENVQTWAIWRNMNNRASGIQLTETGVEWVDGSNRVRLLTSADIPSDAGVISLNGETGVVVITGEDVNVSTTDTRTLSAAISALIATDNSQAADIISLTDRINTAEENISTQEQDIISMGEDIESLNTNVGNLSTSVNDLSGDVSDVETDVQQLSQTVSTLQTNDGIKTTQINNLTLDMADVQTDVNGLTIEMAAHKVKEIKKYTFNGVTNGSGVMYLPVYQGTSEVVGISSVAYPASLCYDLNTLQYFVVVLNHLAGSIVPYANAQVAIDYYVIER